VRSTSVTASVVLVTAHPLLVAALSHLYLHEKASGLTLAGIAVALGGVALIFGSDLGSSNIAGDLLAVGGAVSLGVYLIAGRFKRREGLPELAYTTYVYAGAALTLAVAALVLRSPVGSVSAQDLGLIFLMALIPGMFGHTLYNWALRFLRATVVSATHVIEPVGASLLAFWFFAQQPPPGTALGGAVTLGGILLVVYAEGRAAAARAPPPA
jgi:drug/metabolite transporter (DMT)-like permease